MAAKGKNKPTALAYALIIMAIVITAGAILYSVFGNPHVKTIDITYGQGAFAKAQELTKLSSQDDVNTAIIRTTELFDKEMSEFDGFREYAVPLINTTYGYLYLADVEKTGRSAIRITINCRTSFAVLSGADDIVIDENGIVLELPKKNAATGLIRVSGLDISKEVIGEAVGLNTSDEKLLSNVLMVVKTIKDNGYFSMFDEITMLANNQVRLTNQTKTQVPVLINLRYDVLSSLDIAYNVIIQQGITSGGVLTVTDDEAYFKPDSGDTSSAKGM